MFKYSQLRCENGYDKKDIIFALSKKLNISRDSIYDLKILKESLDARKKPDLFYSLTVAFQTKEKDKLCKLLNGKSKISANLSFYEEKSFELPEITYDYSFKRPVIIGAGPAGLFCAYYLAKAGIKPLVFERGKAVDERKKDVDLFWETGVLNTKSNVQFGEGGAGTFSDGKLNTLNKDPFGYQKEVLSLFVKMGAKERITYEQKPHIGTDVLFHVVKNIREEIIRLGGEVHFSSQVTDFLIDETTQSNRRIKGVVINDSEKIETDFVVLAIGHSARDTFRLLHSYDVPMDAKAFAVGYRVQHLQKDIDEKQYGKENVGKYPAAAYKLTAQSSGGRGVYSFCMCPGGYVVNASSESNRLCVNGMSYSDRAGENANSAIIIAVNPEDFKDAGPLAGVLFQEKIEEKAYQICKGKIPVQRFKDFKENQISKNFGKIKPAIKGQYDFGNLRNVYFNDIEEAFLEGMESFGKKMKGFDDDDVLITGIEPRTSSPVRIHREEDCQSQIIGLYPCGEGAGYAGGITSAACDGLKVALKIIEKFTK